MISRMIPQQPVVFDVLNTAITSGSPAQTVFYLDSKAGHGKLFLASAVCTRLQSENRVPIIVGTTALSVTM